MGTFRRDADAVANAAAASLSAARPDLPEPLSETLARFAEAKIEGAERDLRFIVSNNPTRKTEKEIIERIQFHDYTHNEESEGRIDFSRIESVTDLDAELKRARETWSPRHATNPLSGWRARVPGIAEERSPIGALRRFENLRRDILYFERVVGEAAFELDGWIQQEIDRVRGG